MNNYQPKKFSNFIGQASIIEDINIHVTASAIMDVPIPHVLMYGPPGLGKTTLARIIANERNVNIIEKNAMSINSDVEMKFLLFDLKPCDILFIDEIHRLSKAVMEVLYTPLEDFLIDGLSISPFTLISTTNYAGSLERPLRERIPLKYELMPYPENEITQMMEQRGAIHEVAVEISQRSRGIPRIGRDYLRNIDNYAIYQKHSHATKTDATETFARMKIEENGLTQQDITVLRHLINSGSGSLSRAVGVDALTTALNIDRYDYINMIEPYLAQCGYIQRTNRGRIITTLGIQFMRNKI